MFFFFFLLFSLHCVDSEIETREFQLIKVTQPVRGGLREGVDLPMPFAFLCPFQILCHFKPQREFNIKQNVIEYFLYQNYSFEECQ